MFLKHIEISACAACVLVSKSTHVRRNKSWDRILFRLGSNTRIDVCARAGRNLQFPPSGNLVLGNPVNYNEISLEP